MANVTEFQLILRDITVELKQLAIKIKLACWGLHKGVMPGAGIKTMLSCSLGKHAKPLRITKIRLSAWRTASSKRHSSSPGVPCSCRHCWGSDDMGIFTLCGNVLANRVLLADATHVIVFSRVRILSFSDSNQRPHDDLEATFQIVGSKTAWGGIACDSA